jgi:hypothetical protein
MTAPSAALADPSRNLLDRSAFDPDGGPRPGPRRLVGHPPATNLPVVPWAAQADFSGGGDAFVTCYSAAGAVTDASFLNGWADTDTTTATAVAVSAQDHLFLTGYTNAAGDFPVSDGAYQATNPGGNDAFVVRLPNSPGAADDSYGLLHGRPLSVDVAGGVLANDLVPPWWQPAVERLAPTAHGALALSADGSFDYTPATGYVGPDSFTYVIHSGSLTSNVATVSLDVQDQAPTAPDVTYEVHAGQPFVVEAPGLAEYASDPDIGDTPQFVLDRLPQRGTLTAFGSDGSFTYQPAGGPDGLGTYTFTYHTNDGALNSVSSGTVTLHVTDQAPVAIDDAFDVPAGAPFLADPSRSLLARSAYDLDGDPLSAVLVSPPGQDPAFVLHPDGTFDYHPGGWVGTDSFQYAVTDGTLTSAAATVTLAVSAGPVPHDDVYSLPDSGPLSVPASQGVLTDDFNPGGAQLAAQLVQQPASGRVQLAADGGFVYTPDPNQPPAGQLTFTYRLGLQGPLGVVYLLPALLVPSLTLQQQGFSNVVPLSKDDGSGLYPKAWTPTSGRVPVAAVAGNPTGWTAQFSVTGASLLAVKKERLQIRGLNPDMDPSPFAAPQFKLDVARATLTVVWANVPIDAPAFVNDRADQTWVVRPGWYAQPIDDRQAYGTSQFNLYAMAGLPTKGTLFHSVARVGALAAQAAAGTTPDAIKNAVIAKFQTRSVERADGPVIPLLSPVLTYYANWSVGGTDATLRSDTTPKLLKNGDGNCQAWTAFFLDVLRGQGITGQGTADPGQKFSLQPVRVRGWMFVKNWQGPSKPGPNVFTGVSPVDFGAGRYTWVAGAPVTKVAGIPGQGGTEPPALFNQHQITQFVLDGATVLFDPSYGTTPFTGTDDNDRLRNWQNGSLDYVGQQLGQKVNFHEPKILPTNRLTQVKRVPNPS